MIVPSGGSGGLDVGLNRVGTGLADDEGAVHHRNQTERESPLHGRKIVNATKFSLANLGELLRVTLQVKAHDLYTNAFLCSDVLLAYIFYGIWRVGRI